MASDLAESNAGPAVGDLPQPNGRQPRRADAWDHALRFVPRKHREEIDEAAKYYANKEPPFLASQ
jgi:hypothetical protein